MEILNLIKNKIHQSQNNLKALEEDSETLAKIQMAAQWMIDALKAGHKILVCGNGGSAADAQHFAAEMIGRFYVERRPLPVLAITTDSSTLTCVANDYAYEEVFSRQICAFGQKGDVLLGISTSGSSKNVIKAFEMAVALGMKTILLSGIHKKEIAKHSDLTLCMPTRDTPRVQELHLLVEHTIAELIEKAFVE